MKPTKFLACAVALVAIAGCNSKQGDAATNKTASVAPVKPPQGGDWSEVVTATPAGGFLMGNPAAKVKLIEYGSMTCPHCREFDEKGVPALVDNYVKSGQVSYEYRNYVRDPFDLAASLVVRCNGAKTFFPLKHAMFTDQEEWVGKIQSAPQNQLEALQNMPPSQQFLTIAKIAGLQDWAAMRGVPQAKTTQCLTDENAINQLVQMNSDATTQYPAFQGTPAFVINGKMVENAATWEALEPKLKEALGG